MGKKQELCTDLYGESFDYQEHIHSNFSLKTVFSQVEIYLKSFCESLTSFF